MKKVIFISALAIAAAVSCTKSDIVDTKFDDAIGFQTYVGRDAQTKAAVANKGTLETVGTEIGLYGYYTGNTPWKIGEQAQTAGAIENPTANLWKNGVLKYGAATEGATTNTWFTTEKKYWTNDSDWYSFLAYAPKAADNGITVGTENNGSQTITYTTSVAADGKLTTSVDLLYAQVFNTHKVTTVPLQFKHALSRVTVKASAGSGEFAFDVKEVTLSGTYNTTGTFTLATAAWKVEDTDKKAAYYEFYNNHAASKTVAQDGTVSWDLLSSVDYAGTDNYLMMIPTTFDGKLKVVYTSIYADQESNEMTKEIPVKIDFAMGKAYSLNIVFAPVLDEIMFSVGVTNWDEEHTDYNQGLGNPEDDANNDWVDVTPTTGA